MWRFSDGTVVHLGGLIEGDTIFAQKLRERLSEPTLYPRITLDLPPAEWIRVDIDDPAHVNAWLDSEIEKRRIILSRNAGTPIADARPPIWVVERPENIPSLPLTEYGEMESGLVY